MPNEKLEKFASKRRGTAIPGEGAPQVFDHRDADGRSPGVAAHPGVFRRTGNMAGTGPGVGGTGGGPQVFRSVAKPYHPLFSSPDRLQLPVQLAQLNQYWRLFYNVDPVIGGGIDMLAEMPWSMAYIELDQNTDNSKQVLQMYEDMLTETDLLSWLPSITKEFMIIGEVFPYMHWDDSEGIFSHVTVHNPDYVEVVDSPLIDDDPILTLRPSQEMRRILQSTDPRYVRLRSKLPSDMLALLVGGKNLPLDPINASHIPRRAFPYDIRGTSIMSRMFRILMYEDAVFNGQIQQATRHALPLRVFKIGDAASGWIPPASAQEEFANILAEVEADPLAAIIYPYWLQVEYHGMEGKQIKLTQEWDIIERAKLVALGINKAFLHGEVTYASANAGLQVLMMRLRSMRDKFTHEWLYKKVFATMAELNGFYRDVKKSDDALEEPEPDSSMQRKTMVVKERLQRIAEIKDPDRQAYEYLQIKNMIDEVNRDARIRMIPMQKAGAEQRSRVRKKKMLLYPTIRFDKRLDVRQDENILRMWSEMADKGWVSPRTVVQGAGLDFDSEMGAYSQDASRLMKNQLLAQSLGGEGGGGGGGGGGMPMGDIGIGDDPLGDGAGSAPGSAGGETAPGGAAAANREDRRIQAVPQWVREHVRQDINANMNPEAVRRIAASSDATNPKLFSGV